MTRLRACLVVALLMLGGAARAQTPTTTTQVDLQLVLAVDASGSVNQTRFELQKRGYAAAFRNPRVLAAIRAGTRGAIAVAMTQWTGPSLHVTVVDWMKVSDAASIEALSAAIEAAPRRLFGGGTSISGAIDYAMLMLTASSYRGQRRVIDVSGDGSNNSGRPAPSARDDAVKAGVVINGLPIAWIETDLAAYYRQYVIGGPGSFVIPIDDYDNFADAILNKLVTEIAGAAPRSLASARTR